MKDIYKSKSKTKSKKEKSKKTATPSKGKSAEPKKAVVQDPREYSEFLAKTPQTTNLMTAFMVRPPGVTFDTQDRDELVLVLLRRHFITNVPWIVLVAVMLLLPILFPSLPVLSLLPVGFQIVVVLGWYLLTFGLALERFLSWYFNVYIITDERLIDYDFYSLIYKRVSQAKIDNIEDVTYEMGGVIRSFFHYGTVLIQTAGEKRELDFEEVPRPDLVVKLLNELIQQEEQEKIEGRVR